MVGSVKVHGLWARPRLLQPLNWYVLLAAIAALPLTESLSLTAASEWHAAGEEITAASKLIRRAKKTSSVQTQTEEATNDDHHRSGSPTKSNLSHPSKQKRALLAIYGLQNRDRGCALPSHLKVRDALRSMGFVVDLFVYEMKPQIGEVVDNSIWSSGSLQDISNVYQSEPLSAIDPLILKECGENLAGCPYTAGENDLRFRAPRLLFALRQLYAEEVVARYLDLQAKDAYQLVVAIGSDIVLRHNVSQSDISRAADASNDKLMFVSPNNKWAGYTNGFYMGSVKTVAAAMQRFDFSSPYNRSYYNYETQLKGACDAAGLHVQKLEGHRPGKSFVKLRHDGGARYNDYPAPLEMEVALPIQHCLQAAGAHMKIDPPGQHPGNV